MANNGQALRSFQITSSREDTTHNLLAQMSDQDNHTDHEVTIKNRQ